MLASDIENALEATTGFAVTTVRETSAGVFVPEATNPAHQAAIDAALPGVIADLEAQETENDATQSEVMDMVASFNSGSAATIYFNALQKGLRQVVQNNTPIATFYPAMLDLLNNNLTFYGLFINLVGQTVNLNQATIENPSTDAQRRQVYQVAITFANTGVIQVLFSSLNTL